MIADLKVGEVPTAFFAVQKAEVRSTKDGRPFLSMTLADKTGTVPAVMFDYAGGPVKAGEYVKVRAKVDEYQGKTQLKIIDIRHATAEDKLNPADFLPSSGKDPVPIYAHVLEMAEGISNVPLRQVVTTILNENREKFLVAPAATHMHHAYINGLIIHIESLCVAGLAIAANYGLDADLMVAIAVLHDYAKIYELTYETSIAYSRRGKLYGHIAMGAMNVLMTCRKLKVDEETTERLVHMILSHHGEKQFGSPVVPQTKEALAFHYLDVLDARMNMADTAIEKAAGAEWTERVYGLQNVELFLGGNRDDQ